MFFFFKQKTAYEMRISDWSSDVCSSDLLLVDRRVDRAGYRGQPVRHAGGVGDACDRRIRGVRQLAGGAERQDAARADGPFDAGTKQWIGPGAAVGVANPRIDCINTEQQTGGLLLVAHVAVNRAQLRGGEAVGV